jgi:putative chitinase
VVTFDRKIYYDTVRNSMFYGAMSQSQVDGQEILLDRWEAAPTSDDLRHIAYMLATTFHETAATMQPIEEYGHGKGYAYGVPDPETGQTYYGRGFVQITWRDNYAKATEELDLSDSDNLVWHAARALDPAIAAEALFVGMSEGWFTGKRLSSYFSATIDDPIGARQIVNPDSHGSLIAGYHGKFLSALQAAQHKPLAGMSIVNIDITAPEGVGVEVRVNGKVI